MGEIQRFVDRQQLGIAPRIKVDAEVSASVEGVYNETPLELTDQDTAPLQLDAEGRLLVAASVEIPAPEGGATEAKQDDAIALLTTIDEDTGAIAATLENVLSAGIDAATALDAASATTAVAATGDDVGFVAQVLRDDALDTLGPADGAFTQLRVDSIGRLWTVDGGNRSAVVDSILTVRGVPPGATPFHIHYSDSTARGAGSAATVFDPPSGAITVITDVEVSCSGTTAGKIILYYGADADTTYSQGTDVPIAVESHVPASTVAPGSKGRLVTPVASKTANDQVKYQNSAAIAVDIIIRGYTYVPA